MTRRPGNRVRNNGTAAEQLDRAYAAIPDARCRGLCTDSCHSYVMTPAEQSRIRADTGMLMPLVHAGEPCPALDGAGRCGIYEVLRPAICRLWGSVDHPFMRCPYGCEPEGGLMSNDDARRILADVARAGRRAVLPQNANSRPGG